MMNIPDIPIQVVENGKMPVKAHPTDACFDCSVNTHPGGMKITFWPGQVTPVRLGFRINIPEGWKARLFMRSGLARDLGLTCHIATIDPGYLDEVVVLIQNWTSTVQHIKHGDRICQMEIEPIWPVVLVEENFPQGVASRGGFGSTGR